MGQLKSFAELKEAVGMEEELEDLRAVIALQNRKLKEQRSQLVELAAYVTSTSQFYDWLIDRQPYNKEEKISNLRLAMMFFADQERRP